VNYLSVEAVSKSYGTKVLFENVSFGISQGQKVALVARNGAGKSSLLRIITGKDAPDSGKVTLRKGITMAYLEQDPKFDESKTAMEVLFSTETPVLKAIRDYEIALDLQSKADTPQNRLRLEESNAEMDMLKAWDYEVKIKQVLTRLQLEFLDKKISQLSGGQKKRVALAQVLITEPDLVIMDEPTNHLDIDMIEWLEDYLISKDVALLLVTHDRYFLDRICDEIIELDNGKLYTYKGSYSYYVEKKAEREAGEASEIDKAKNLYRREIEWVRRMPKARGTKSKSRLNAFEDIKDKAFQRRHEGQVQLDVKMSRMGSKILELIKLSKRYGDQTILDSFSYVFKKGEKIGIVGKNGVGKSTFLNIILGREGYDSGKIQTGETIVFGYYSQDGLIMNEDKRVIEVVKDIADFIPLANGSTLTASQMLQRFMFPPDMQYTFVSKLSGGEKRRLYLLTVLMKNPNFLVLDEPTNDLDIMTLGVLEDFLHSFPGCVVIVSHDRYFMDKVVDHMFVFEGEGEIKDYPGNYSEYREWADEREREEKQGGKSQPAVKAAPVQAPVPEQPTPAEKKKMSFKEKFEYESLEKEIPKLEAQKAILEEKLASGISDHAELQKVSDELGRVMKQLEEKTDRWLELSEMM
jgi:ABC transport system ATP-binding/permease protein